MAFIKIGHIYRIKSNSQENFYLLINCPNSNESGHWVTLVSLHSGSFLSDPIKVLDLYNISLFEFFNLFEKSGLSNEDIINETFSTVYENKFVDYINDHHSPGLAQKNIYKTNDKVFPSNFIKMNQNFLFNKTFNKETQNEVINFVLIVK